MQGPDLYEYLDYRAFLRDWYAAKKGQDASFSKRAFARLAGKSSPGLLTEVIEARRTLTQANARAFSKALGLSRAGSEFFGALVQLEQARTPQSRNEAWSVVAASKAFREARPIAGSSVKYLSHWYYSAIRELAAVPGFQHDAEWIARTLRPQVTVAQARKALSLLEELELIRQGEDGAWTTADGIVTTPHEVHGLVAHNYHYGMLDRAREAIERFEPHQRHFVAATVAIPKHLMPQVKREIDALQERILQLAESEATSADEVFQVNLHVFPLSCVQPVESV